ncbi:MAG: hypothetical protein R2838_12590 [Caldilineaceae bacterium]
MPSAIGWTACPRYSTSSARPYATCLSGKWHLGQSHLAPTGCDEHFGCPTGRARTTPRTPTSTTASCRIDGNKSAHITTHGLAFLDSLPDDRPFFLNVGYIATQLALRPTAP